MVGTVYKTAGAALALVLGATAVTTPASAQDRGDRGWGEHRGGGDRGGGDRAGNGGGDRGNPGGGWTARSESQPAPRPAPDRPNWNGGGRPEWNGGGRPDWNRPQPQPAPQRAAPQDNAPGYRSYSDPARNRGYGGPPPAAENRAPPQQGWDGRRWNGQNWNDRDRDGRADGPRPGWQRERGWDSNRGWDRDRGDPRRGGWSAGRPGGQWDRDWRRDYRYNWQAWRDSHRDVYRLGRYVPPYRTYGYRRLSIGFFLDGGFFGSSYWIGDPWRYRLPPAYGPYRWVRYYDDALLVDTYTGEVVDVIYDVFW